MDNIDARHTGAASDLVDFLGREHFLSLDLQRLDCQLPLVADDSTKLSQSKGRGHESAYGQDPCNEGRIVTDIGQGIRWLEAKSAAALEAVLAGQIGSMSTARWIASIGARL